MKKIISFLSYHNAVPIVGIALALGASATFAATAGVLSLPEAAGSAASSTPPDVSYLLSVDLDSYTPTAQVTGITQDSQNYYVAYALSTIALVGNAWQPTVENETMTISKAQLGAYRDLGLYVAGLLQQRTAQELAYLQRVQALAQSDASGAQTVSAYADLIGKTLDADSSAIPGYTPVVENPLPDIASAPVAPAPQRVPQQTVETAPSVADDDAPPADVATGSEATSTPEDISATSTDATSSQTDATSTADSADATSSEAVSEGAETDATSTDQSASATSPAATSTPPASDADTSPQTSDDAAASTLPLSGGSATSTDATSTPQ